MDRERVDFVFGTYAGIDVGDIEDELQRQFLLDQRAAERGEPAAAALEHVIANQVLDDDPPAVWATTQRLLAAGIERERVLRQLALTFGPFLMAAVDGEPFDPDAYVAALDRLPMPTAEAAEAAMVEVVRSSPGIAIRDMQASVLERLGRDPDDQPTEMMIDQVIEHLLDDRVLSIAPPDRLSHIASMTADVVLTHRLTRSELETGTLDVSFDLAGFGHLDELRLADGSGIVVGPGPLGTAAWTGVDGWLGSHEVDALIAVRVHDGVVHVDVVDPIPPRDDGLADRLRNAYDVIVEEPWLPVSGESLVMLLLLDDPTTFDQPQVPLAEFAAVAGLERRHHEVAHDESVWHSARRSARHWRTMDRFDERDDQRAAMRALDIADLVAGLDPDVIPDFDGPIDDALLRDVLADLRDLDIRAAVVDELTNEFDDDEPTATLDAFIDALRAVASRQRDVAVVHVLAGLAAERANDPIAAEQHLLQARRADPDAADVIERLAWYASDRGDAAGAIRLFRELEPDRFLAQAIDDLEPYATASGRSLGRNEPCWCGSGRKYKQCHLGEPDLAPLSDRVPWLCRKAVMFIERQGPLADLDVFAVAQARALDPDDGWELSQAFSDPIVIDLALTEWGWFDRFIEARGALLPADEALLAQAWMLVDRTVYEVIERRAGEGLVVRDLRTGERHDVRERTFSHQTTEGALVCARAVPDGETHQFVGGVFPVKPGRERELLDLLDTKDPMLIAGWVRALHLPPELTTREGEPLVHCDVVVRVADRAAARAFLDATYEPGPTPDSWVEMHPIDEYERIVRASIELVGNQLEISTTSEPRADRVIDALRAGLDGCEVTRDVRTPAGAAPLSRLAGRGGGRSFDLDHLDDLDDAGDGGLDLSDPQVLGALSDIRDKMEQRWCIESIPALGGLTPREAAADPTRREEVVRLIASFEGFEAGGDLGPTLTMRPARLRELLDL